MHYQMETSPSQDSGVPLTEPGGNGMGQGELNISATMGRREAGRGERHSSGPRWRSGEPWRREGAELWADRSGIQPSTRINNGVPGGAAGRGEPGENHLWPAQQDVQRQSSPVPCIGGAHVVQPPSTNCPRPSPGDALPLSTAGRSLFNTRREGEGGSPCRTWSWPPQKGRRRPARPLRLRQRGMEVFPVSPCPWPPFPPAPQLLEQTLPSLFSFRC